MNIKQTIKQVTVKLNCLMTNYGVCYKSKIGYSVKKWGKVI